MWTAVTREVSPAFDRCELTHKDREPIDLALARQQHRAYESCLEALGCEIRRLPAEPDLPDSVFVEDGAIVLDELAVLTRPGAESRRPEVPSLKRILKSFRRVVDITPPATLDGGDVLLMGRKVFVGLSTRTRLEAVQQLHALLTPHGYEIVTVEVKGCLHLKSAACPVAPGTLLINRDWVETEAFQGLDLIDVNPAEPSAANALLIGDRIIYATAHSRTAASLGERGLMVRQVDISESIKAEGGVTCSSLVFRS